MEASLCLALDLLFHKVSVGAGGSLEQATDPGWRPRNRSSEFVNIDTRKIPAEYWPVVLPICGPHVRHISGTWNICNKLPFRLIVNECPFLESIEFNVNKDNWIEITSLLLNAKTLKSVHLHISADFDASENILKALIRLPNLTKLLLHGLDFHEVYQLEELIHLKDLSLALREDSPPINIFEVLSALKNLRILHISNIKILDNNNLCSSEQLENLEIVSCDTYWLLPHFPKLKSLRFRKNLNCSPDFRLSKWILRHTQTLEFLELLWFTIPDEDLLETVQNCKKLKTLHFGGDIDWEFVKPFMEALNANGGFSLENPLQLVFKNVEEVKTMFYRSPYIGLVYIRSPTLLELCAWDCLE